MKKYLVNKKIIFISILLLAVFLRLYRLSAVPPALHGDELGAPYNAYLLLKTGRDEDGRILPFSFRNDFSPLIFYITVPFVWFGGLSEFAARLPSIVAGILLIVIMFLLTRKLTNNTKIAFVVLLLLSVSSWHIRFSRVALEMIWALVFQMAGILFYIKSQKISPQSIFVTLLCFGLSMVSYQSAKVTSPLLLGALIWFYGRPTIKKYLTYYLGLAVIFLIIPQVLYIISRPFHSLRFVGISIVTVWKNSYASGTNLLTLKPLTDLLKMLFSNYFVHFHPDYLFLDNSPLRYFQLEGIGIFYLWYPLFIALGVIYLFKFGGRLTYFLGSWVVISPLAAALTTGVPVANVGRNLLLFPALEIIAAVGFVKSIKYIRSQCIPLITPILIFIFLLMLSLSLFLFLKTYYITMPIKTYNFWGTPLKIAMSQIIEYEDKVDSIIITNFHNQSYMYVLFYGRKTPEWFFFQSKIKSNIVGFTKMGKYEFRNINWEKDKALPNTLLVGKPEEIPIESSAATHIYGTNGDIVLRLYKTK